MVREAVEVCCMQFWDWNEGYFEQWNIDSLAIALDTILTVVHSNMRKSLTDEYFHVVLEKPLTETVTMAVKIIN